LHQKSGRFTHNLPYHNGRNIIQVKLASEVGRFTHNLPYHNGRNIIQVTLASEVGALHTLWRNVIESDFGQYPFKTISTAVAPPPNYVRQQ
jgi:uncharacterized protein YegP (UPF0339 family)